MFEAAQRIEKAVDFKIAEGSRERGARRFFERIVVALAVAHQVLDADDAKAFALGEGEQFFGAHHLPVFAHNLTAETGGLKTREAAEVNGRLGVATALEHAVRAGKERKEMTGAAKIGGNGILGDQLSGGQGALCGADACGGLHVIDGDQKGGLVVIAVYGRHCRERELFRIACVYGEADQSAAQTCHLVHKFCACKFRRTDQIALVFPLGVVHTEYRFAAPQRFERLFNRRKSHDNSFLFINRAIQ